MKYIASCNEMFGTLLLLVINVWSDWNQTPWAHCNNLNQTRALIKAARSWCLQQIARKPTLFKTILFRIVEADAEGGFLASGLSKVASELYHSFIKRVNEANN